MILNETNMKLSAAIQVLREMDEKNKYVFTKHDLAKLFSKDNEKAFDEGLNRLVKAGIMKRVCRGIYVNSYAQSFDSYTIEHIAKALRRNEYNYVSLESILSEYGVISQIPLNRLTVMTTGRKGIYKTFYGIIEFTHTKRSIINILAHIKTVKERPLRIATKKTALRDLKRVGRNLHLIQTENIDDE
jgi:predicted transcriptional regulator of viral defense system